MEDRLYPVSEGKLVNDFLLGALEVDLPGVLPVGLGQLHVAAVVLAEVVEEVLVEAGVLDVVGGDLWRVQTKE